MPKDSFSLVANEHATSVDMNIDKLTKLPNRRRFKMVAEHLLTICERNNLGVELLLFDLDGLKAINDTRGLGAGNSALEFFAQLLLGSFRKGDLIARIGGDEFAVLMAAQRPFSDRALKEMEKRASGTLDEVCRLVKWSVGRVPYDPDQHADIDSLLNDAELRVYSNKSIKRPSLA